MLIDSKCSGSGPNNAIEIYESKFRGNGNGAGLHIRKTPTMTICITNTTISKYTTGLFIERTDTVLEQTALHLGLIIAMLLSEVTPLLKRM